MVGFGVFGGVLEVIEVAGKLGAGEGLLDGLSLHGTDPQSAFGDIGEVEAGALEGEESGGFGDRPWQNLAGAVCNGDRGLVFEFFIGLVEGSELLTEGHGDGLLEGEIARLGGCTFGGFEVF